MQMSSTTTWWLTFMLVAIQGLNTVAWATLGLDPHWVAAIGQADGYLTTLLLFAIHGTVPGVSSVQMPKAVAAFLAVALGALVLYGGSAHAQPTPKPKPRPVASVAAPAAGKLTVTQAQQNPLAVIQQFTATDLNNALADANAQTPPDTVAAACYTALLTVVNNPINNPLPNAPGAFLLFQKGRDLQALLANLQSPTGPLAPINTACAPLVLSAQNTLIQLGIIGGGVTAVAATGGAGLTAMPLLSQLLAVLPK